MRHSSEAERQSGQLAVDRHMSFELAPLAAPLSIGMSLESTTCPLRKRCLSPQPVQDR
jgi:hypothetical protein